ncbi:PorV/PorQ family protein [Candidatus Kapabacteria bacterium]|nr:PorV/PorQ family protein [Candidatus Kapabacteria bacterium]
MNNGGYGFSYLQRDAGTRASSMGGAYTAIVNEPTGLFYNPAGVAFLPDQSTITTSVNNLGLGRSHATLAWGESISETVGIGFGINSFNSGAFQGTDIRGNSTQELQDWQYSFNLALAYMKDNVSIGISAKYLKQNLFGSDINSQGIALDIGTRFDLFEMVSIGMSVQNLASVKINREFDERSGVLETIPWSVRAGLAMEFGLNEKYISRRSPETGKLEQIYMPPTEYILISLDAVQYQFDANPQFQLGIEALPDERIALRAGFTIMGFDDDDYQFLPMTNWGAGVSFRPSFEFLPFGLFLDYTVAREYVINSGISHNIGFMLEF